MKVAVLGKLALFAVYISVTAARELSHSEVPVLPKVHVRRLNTNINVGDSVHLLCYVTNCSEPIDIVWMFEDEPLSENPKFYETRHSTKCRKAVATKYMLKEYSGTYTCTARNKAGEDSQSLDLDVGTHKIGFETSLQESYTFQHGEDATFTCQGESGTSTSWAVKRLTDPNETPKRSMYWPSSEFTTSKDNTKMTIPNITEGCQVICYIYDGKVVKNAVADVTVH